MSPCAAGVPSAACEPPGPSRPSSVRSPRPPTMAFGSSTSVCKTTISISSSRPTTRGRSVAASGASPSAWRGRQPRPRPARARLGRQVSRQGARHAARDAPLPGLRVAQSRETLRGRMRPGSLLVGAVVRRVAGARRARGRGGAGGPGAHLACRRRLAAARPASDRRAAARSARPDKAATGGELPGRPIRERAADPRDGTRYLKATFHRTEGDLRPRGGTSSAPRRLFHPLTLPVVRLAHRRRPCRSPSFRCSEAQG